MRERALRFRLPFVLLLPHLLASCGGTEPPFDVDALVASMTLEEKLSLLRGDQDPEGWAGAGYMPGIPRLGIPPLRLADGPAGVRTRWPATALPAPVALGASFDPGLARAFGAVIGREGRALRQDVLLSPMVNIVRVPHAGRNFETFSEDPLLSARMVAEEVRGVEGEGLIATVKHYAANNFERGRTSTSAELSPRALREIYLPGFEAAVGAGVGAVMCAYNRVNGEYACDSHPLLTEVLRGELGFEGWVMTDWGARHSLAALEKGLDQEMPGGSGSARQPVYFGDSLRAAVEEGRIPEALVDRAVARILRPMARMGLLDGSASPRPTLDEEGGAAVALQVALAGGVLLRNEGGILPLDPSRVDSLLIVGPTAAIPLIGGGGSSRVPPLRRVSLMEALQRRAAGGVELQHVTGMDLQGVTIPSSALAPSNALRGGSSGLLHTTAEGDTLGVDPVVDHTGDEALPAQPARSWEGTLTAPASGDYELLLQTGGTRATLMLDGETVLSTGGFGGGSLLPTADGLSNAGATVRLEAGVPRDLLLRVQGGAGRGGGPDQEAPVEVRLAWITPPGRTAALEEAVQASRKASAVVVMAHQEGTEGADRPSLSLPGIQDELIARIARINPNTVVVLNTGAPVLMPWIDEVGAVLQMWYPGQEGGEATAALLLGEANPRGKLPVTFSRAEDQHPTGDLRRYPGVEGRALYEEDIFVGYRWFDAEGVEPLFPFGHGLSYTTFTYRDLEVRPAGKGFEVAFTLTNSGDRTGVEVAQFYLGAPDSPPAPMAPRALADFLAVELQPGESRSVTLRIDERALSWWSGEEHAWRVAPGARPVYVGSSSRDIRLHGEAR